MLSQDATGKQAQEEKRRGVKQFVRFMGLVDDNLLSALGKWGRTQMGSDGFNRILTGF